MKKIICLLGILFYLHSFSFAQSVFDGLDYYRVYTNYNGSAYNGNSILVYGEGGIIVRSLDGGNNWLQTNLDDSFNIISITNIGHEYYGVLNKKYLIKSTDDGAAWLKSDFGDSTSFYKIIASRGNLYCMSKSNIIVCDPDLNKIKEYPFVTDSAYFSFTITGNNLYFSAGHGKLGLINLQNDHTNIVNLQDLGICTDCPVITNLFTDNNMTYFQLKDNLYQYDGTKVQLVYSDVNFGYFTANNNEIFEIYNNSYFINTLDSLYFIRIDKATKQAIQVKTSGNDRYISNLSFNNIQFLTKDTIIAVGKDKLIYMSYDRGKTWQLKSNLSLNGIVVRNDAIYSFSIQPYAKFVKTTDGGTTWLPQKNYIPYSTNYKFKDIYNGTTYNFRDNNNGFFYKYTGFQDDTNFVYTNDACESIKLKSAKQMIGYGNDLPYLTMNIYDNTLIVNTYSIFGEKYTLLFLLNDTIGIFKYSVIDSSQIIFCDKFNGDGLYAITRNWRYARQVGYTWYWDSVNYSIIISNDSGKTWHSEYDFDLPFSDYPTFPIPRIKDNLIFSYMHRNADSTRAVSEFYKFDMNTHQLDHIYTKDSLSMGIIPGITHYGNKVFINGYYSLKNLYKVVLFENDDFKNHPSEWKDITPTSRYANLVLNVQKDSLLFISAYDSLMHSKVLWFAKPQTVTSVEIQNENPHSLYISIPIPNPAHDYVKARVYWDMHYNIDNAVVSVYDLFGRLVSSKNNFKFNKINSYSGDLYWYPVGVSTGVYFISVSLNNTIKAVPVIVME